MLLNIVRQLTRSMSTKKIKTVLVDLSGTIHIGNTVTPGAVEALTRLKSAPDVEVKFVTNTTSESRRSLHSRLVKLGFDIKQDEIVSSLSAARDLVEKQSLKPYYLVSDEALEEFEGLTGWDESEADCVVVGLAPKKFERQCLNVAFRVLMRNPKNLLIAIHKAKYYKTEEGTLSLGPGTFVQMFEYATGIKPIVVGKPSSNFFNTAIHPLTDTTNVFMIGDDVLQDVEGAQNIGIKGFLVKTGKYRPGDEGKISPQPFRTVDNFARAVEEILQSA